MMMRDAARAVPVQQDRETTDYGGPDETVNGLPGTGKTTYLLDTFIHEVENGVRPTDIAAVTFRRAMASEFRDRIEGRLGDDLAAEGRNHWVRTVHSACFRLLGLSREQVVDDEDRFEVSKAVGVPFRGGMADDEDEDDRPAWMQLSSSSGAELGNRLFDLRSHCIQTFRDPATGWRDTPAISVELRQSLGSSPGLVERFNEEYERYKRENGLSDFDDMLLDVYRDGVTPPVRVLIEDEYQDKTPLQVAIHRQWAEQTERVYVAGDVQQTLYGFMGTDPSFMTSAINTASETTVLDTSYRFGPDLWEFATGILADAGVSDVPDIEPVGESSVERIGMPEYRNVVADIADEDTLHLVRANYMADTAGDVLKQAGVPFRNARWGVRWSGRMYRLYNASAALVRAVAESADEFGTPDYSELSQVDARHLVKPLPAAMFAGQKRTKRKLDVLDATDGDGFADIDLNSWFDPTELHALLDEPTPFDAMNPSAVGSDDIRERLKEAWRVRDGAPIGDLTHTITTIHGAKGAEADTVFLYDGSTKRIQRDADPTTEARVWFVGATRAKNQLYVVSSDEQHSQPLPEVGGR